MKTETQWYAVVLVDEDGHSNRGEVISAHKSADGGRRGEARYHVRMNKMYYDQVEDATAVWRTEGRKAPGTRIIEHGGCLASEQREKGEEILWNQFVARLPQCDALEDADDLQGALRGVAVHHDECSCDALLYIRQYADGHVTVEYPELRDVTSYADLKAWENAQADAPTRRRARAYKCTCAHCGGFIGLEREAHCDTFGTCEGCQGEGADGFDVAELVLQGANPSPENLDCMDARELFQESIREGTPQAYRAYAAMKREAVLKRLKGETQWAMKLEANTDKLYKKIPAEWKW